MNDPARDAAAPAEEPAFAAFEGRLRRWLREELGVTEERRLARLDDGSALISKFERGFAPQLHALLERLPELLDEPVVLAAYAVEAAHAGPEALRTDAWDRALRRLLRDVCAARGLDDDRQQAFVRVGVDSVRAVLESVLWTAPCLGDRSYAPQPGERAAYLDATRHLAGRDLFTRHYGTFEAHAVENHCPGAAYARVMLAHAWRACTGTPPPTE